MQAFYDSPAARTHNVDMSGMSVTDLAKCRDASVLLGAFDLHANDRSSDVKHLFFAPSRQRLELLRWVLIAIDPSGSSERELAGDDSIEALTKRVTSVLLKLNPRRAKEFAAFAEGTAPESEQKRLWQLLLGSAEFGQNSEASSRSSTAPCTANMTFKPTVASTPMPQVEPVTVSSSNVKHEGKTGRCLWRSDDRPVPVSKAADGKDPVDHLVNRLEESIRLNKAKLDGAVASQEPDEAPLDVLLCRSYRQAAERLVKAGERLSEVPPPCVPPVRLDEEAEKLVADTTTTLEALKANLYCATALRALNGYAKDKPCGPPPKS